MAPTRITFLAAILFTWGTIEASEPNLWIKSFAQDEKNPSVVMKRNPPLIGPKGPNGSLMIPKDFEDIGIIFQSASRALVGCGSHSLAPGETVTIQSKNHPGLFPKRHRCQWDFVASSPDSTISISCPVFRLKKCKASSVIVEGGDFLKTYCKKKDGLLASSTTNNMTIIFKTHTRWPAIGFECNVTASEPPAGCKCGHVNRNDRITGGNPTEVHEYPWQVALTDAYSKQPLCGGSIISDQWILTAAQCVDGESPSNIRIVIGEHNWSSDSETNITERREISQFVMHPNYNNQNTDNNIALVKLTSPIEFSTDNKIAPVCLPPSGDLYENVNATVTGWGILSLGGSQPDELKEVTVPTMSNDQCKSSMGTFANIITMNMICAGLGTDGEDFCQGDNGGPLVTEDADSMIQIGVASFSLDCELTGYPGVYTRVNNYLEWIASTTNGSTTCPP